MTSTDERITKVISDVLRISPGRVTDGLSMQSLDEWDSLRHMELIGALEEAFVLQLTFDEIVTMRSVGEIRRVLKARAREGA